MTQILWIIIPALIFGAIMFFVGHEHGYDNGHKEGQEFARLGEIANRKKTESYTRKKKSK